MSTVLIIGDVAMSLKMMSAEVICRGVETAEEFRQVYAEFADLKTHIPLVLHDISKIRRATQLAKFLEETQLKVICLASEDNLQPVIESRFLKVIKRTDGVDFVHHDKKKLKERIESGKDVSKAVLMYAPTAIAEVWMLSRSRFKHSLLDLLEVP